MINENRVSKYLLYAVGEIVLVVIGILLALQINTWNSERINQKEIRNYYSRIRVELNSELASLSRFRDNQARLVSMNRKTLEILNSQNRDSIPVLKKTLGALGTSWILNLEFPIIQEFLNQDYLSKIENDSIKTGFKSFKLILQSVQTSNDYTSNQYTLTIEPFFNANINYSEVALQRYQKYMLKGGPPTDFEALFDNLELWNIVTFKLENLEIEKMWTERYIVKLKWLDEQLLKELEQSE